MWPDENAFGLNRNQRLTFLTRSAGCSPGFVSEMAGRAGDAGGAPGDAGRKEGPKLVYVTQPPRT